jgi:hypothetical protein
MECRTLFADVFLQGTISDRSLWRPSVGDGYTGLWYVSNAYEAGDAHS